MLLFLSLCLFLESASVAGNYGQHSPNSYSALMRSRRQANEEAYCSTSFAQNYINAISECGDRASSEVNNIEASFVRTSKVCSVERL